MGASLNFGGVHTTKKHQSPNKTSQIFLWNGEREKRYNVGGRPRDDGPDLDVSTQALMQKFVMWKGRFKCFQGAGFDSVQHATRSSWLNFQLNMVI